jgi:hypothetical protein
MTLKNLTVEYIQSILNDTPVTNKITSEIINSEANQADNYCTKQDMEILDKIEDDMEGDSDIYMEQAFVAWAKAMVKSKKVVPSIYFDLIKQLVEKIWKYYYIFIPLFPSAIKNLPQDKQFEILNAISGDISQINKPSELAVYIYLSQSIKENNGVLDEKLAKKYLSVIKKTEMLEELRSIQNNSDISKDSIAVSEFEPDFESLDPEKTRFDLELSPEESEAKINYLYSIFDKQKKDEVQYITLPLNRDMLYLKADKNVLLKHFDKLMEIEVSTDYKNVLEIAKNIHGI